jgi:hypothetical protein
MYSNVVIVGKETTLKDIERLEKNFFTKTLKIICNYKKTPISLIVKNQLKKTVKKGNSLFLPYCLFSYPIILKDGTCYKGTRRDLDTIEPYTTGTSDSHTDSSEIVSKF